MRLAVLQLYGGTWQLVEQEPHPLHWNRTTRVIAAGTLAACETANRLLGERCAVDDAQRMQARKSAAWDADGAPIEEPMPEPYTAEERDAAETAYDIFRRSEIGQSWRGLRWQTITPQWQERWLVAARELLRERRAR